VSKSQAKIHVVTANHPGAVGVIQLHGSNIAVLLESLTGIKNWPIASMQLVEFADIDRGLAVCLRQDWAQVMPHGGLRVMRRILDHLVELGAVYQSDAVPRDVYPEASSDLEADMLTFLARATSPAAIDLLLAQPQRWANGHDVDRQAIATQSRALRHLVEPADIVVIGRANVGKSTLTNWMLGRSASIVADLPGTTRDWVAGLAQLTGPSAADTDHLDLSRGVTVRWMDTPGLRKSGDAVEQAAIALAQQVIAEADVLIAMRDPQISWPEIETLRCQPDIWVINKIDDPAAQSNSAVGDSENPLPISALLGHGLDALQVRIFNYLGLTEIDPSVPWAFSPELRRLLDGGSVDSAEMDRYQNATAQRRDT